jgi:F-type H+-transporting ATPase subunit b
MADPTTAPAAAGGGGLPQFDMAPWPGEIFWALLIFGVLYFLIAKVFLPRVAGTIDDREDRISGDIGDARRARDAAREEMETAAGELAAARARAQKLAHDAQAEAKAAATARQAQEEARLAEALAAAEARIAVARAAAMVHVRAIAVETAQAMVARLTGAEASADEVERALPGALAS